MVSSSITLILVILFAFFPVVIWAYIFSYIDDSKLSKKRFLSGIFAGALSVGPIIYMEQILEFLRLESINIFSFLGTVWSISNWLPSFISLTLFLVFFICLSLLTQLLFKRKIQLNQQYIKSISVSFWSIIVILFLFCFMDFIPFLSSEISSIVRLDSVILDSLKLVIAYYIIIAFIEEGSKYFQFLGWNSLKPENIKVGILYAIFIALWFSFVENILYIYFMYTNTWLSGELFKLYFFRWVFSIVLHVLCSVVFAYASLRAFYFSSSVQLKTFVIGGAISIALHALFDISITLGFPIIMIVYFIGGYLYVSSLFYSEAA